MTRKAMIDILVEQDLKESRTNQDYLDSILRCGLKGYNNWTMKELTGAMNRLVVSCCNRPGSECGVMCIYYLGDGKFRKTL